MDKSKQPGISFDGIILVGGSFWRDYQIPNDVKIDVKFEAKNTVDGNKATTEVITKLLLKSEKEDVVKLECTFVANFSIIEGNENMDIYEYVENNAVALMFPYIREYISTITGKAGMHPILLPPMNIIAALNKEEH